MLLYVHPNGHLNDLVVPAGSLSCMNAVDVPKRGRYAFELMDEEIRDARVIAMDLHWALAISGFERLVRHVRATNPTAPIVVGGVTAGHYALELLERYPVDYVVRGDSETSFARLIRVLGEGGTPDDIPNVFGRGRPLPRLCRMTQQEFDATDCLTADWFPTYSRVSNWDAVAFPQGRTIPVSRGCAFTCPECYGSYASTYGKGYLLRSPASLAALIRRAEAMQVRNLRLFVAKPPSPRLTALLRALADAGPFRFSSAVGFYLCAAPSDEDLDLLSSAFENEVVLSMIPPEEHVPVLRPKRLAIEQSAWQRVSRRVPVSGNLTLDAWTTARGNFASTRQLLQVESAPQRVKVSFGTVWSVTRPTDAGDKHAFDEVKDAVMAVWTFYLARLLSPALATLLAPFQFMDELDTDPTLLAEPPAPLAGYFEALMASWRQHHLASIPGLGFSVVQVALRAGARSQSAANGISFGGAMTFLPGDAFDVAENVDPVPLTLQPDHRGIALEAQLAYPHQNGILAIVPQPLPTGRVDKDWLHDIGSHGLVGLRARRPSAAPEQHKDAALRILLRAQEAYVALLGPSGPLARGKADMGYFRIRDRNPEA